MGNLSELLFTGDEGAFNTNSNTVQYYSKEQGGEHFTTRGHASFSEVAVQSSRRVLRDRVEADERKR